MILAFANPSTRPFLNASQQPARNSYNDAAATPWSLPVQVPGAPSSNPAAAEASHELPSLAPSRSLGMAPTVVPGGGPVWFPATAQAAAQGDYQKFAVTLALLLAAAAVGNDQGVYLRTLEAPATSVAPSAAAGASFRVAAERRVPRTPAVSAGPGGRLSSPVATDGCSGTEDARLTGLDARRTGARYGVIPAWATEPGTQRGRSTRRPRTANTLRSPSRSPTRQRRDGSEEGAPAIPGRIREGTHDAGERVDDATMSDLIYFITSTSVGTRRVLSRMEQQSVIVSNQQLQVQCVLNRIAVYGDMAVRARQEAVESERAIKEKMDAIMAMLNEKLVDEIAEDTYITEEEKAAWVLDVAVSSSRCFRAAMLATFALLPPFFSCVVLLPFVLSEAAADSRPHCCMSCTARSLVLSACADAPPSPPFHASESAR